MKKTTLLAASIALALAGCGGSDNNDNPTAKSFSVTAIDGYLVNADVYAGENCQTKVATTGKGGNAGSMANIRDKHCVLRLLPTRPWMKAAVW